MENIENSANTILFSGTSRNLNGNFVRQDLHSAFLQSKDYQLT